MTQDGKQSSHISDDLRATAAGCGAAPSWCVHIYAGAASISRPTIQKGLRELVGAFKNGGREWPPQGWPERVHVHDFPDPHLGKAIPYGIDDVGRNAGRVTVGQDHATASFAVATLRRWWQGSDGGIEGAPVHVDSGGRA